MKYLELIKGQFTADHEARAKLLEPYVAYSVEADGVMYNFIPEPVVGPADNEIWYTSKDGNIVTPNVTDAFGANIVSNTYEDGKGVITFDNSVTSIGDDAFFDCGALTSITIPNSVTSIGSNAFIYCSHLASVVIPDSVTSIGWSAFLNCTSLAPLYNAHWFIYMPTSYSGAYTIPEGIEQIAHNAFDGIEFLTSVTIPNSVTNIENSAFLGCPFLTSITFEGTMEEWNIVSKGDYWYSDTPATYVQCTDGQVTL